MSSNAILLAAGSGKRMQGRVEDKILTPIGGQAAFLYSVLAFIQSGCVAHLTIVYRDSEQQKALNQALASVDLQGTDCGWVQGGKERQDSVYNALKAQNDECEFIYIHDCARPMLTTDAIQALDRAVRQDAAACLAHPVVDTIKRIPESGQLSAAHLEDLDRNRLWAMETPQVFSLRKILSAYEHVRSEGLQITDDTAAAATIGLGTTLVPNPSPNPKLTSPEDLAYIEFLLTQLSQS